MRPAYLASALIGALFALVCADHARSATSDADLLRGLDSSARFEVAENFGQLLTLGVGGAKLSSPQTYLVELESGGGQIELELGAGAIELQSGP
jgi:hypothetical protein